MTAVKTTLIPAGQPNLSTFHGYSAFQEFPWFTGIPLLKGKQKETISICAGDEADPTTISFLTAIAQSLDDFDAAKAFQSLRSRENTTKYLSANAENLMKVDQWNDLLNTDVNAASHLLMRYSVLDRLADAFGTPQQSTFVSSARRFLPSLSRAFDNVLKPFADWTNPIAQAQILRKRAGVVAGQSTREDSIFLVEPSAQLSRDQGNVCSKVAMLRRAANHINSAKLNQILTNMELLAFGIGWFGLSQSNDFDQSSEWIDKLKEQTALAGSPLKETFVQELQKGKVYDRMRNLFHTAASVTPLVALLPYLYQNFNAKRYHFIAARVAYGNQRPPLLAVAEKELWKALIRINIGSDALQELSTFLDCFDILQKQQNEDPQLDWFVSEGLTGGLLGAGKDDGQGSSAVEKEVPVSSRGGGLKKRHRSPSPAGSTSSGNQSRASPPSSERKNRPAKQQKRSHVLRLPPSPAKVTSTHEESYSASQHSEEEAPSPPSTPGGNGEEEEDGEADGETGKLSGDCLSAASGDDNKGEEEKGGHGEEAEDEVEGEDAVEGEEAVAKAKKGRPSKRMVKSVDGRLLVKRKDQLAKFEGVVQKLFGKHSEKTKVKDLPLPKFATKPFTLQLFDDDASHKPLTHNYYATSNTQFEYDTLGAIQNNVTSHFFDGAPLYRHPSARCQRYDSNKRWSAVYVCDWPDFQKLPAEVVQSIYRHRHILVRKGPVETVKFDLEGLELLGPLTKEVDFQVAELRFRQGEKDLLRDGTLLDLHTAGTQKSKARILNGLDLPMGYRTLPPPLQYRYLATQEMAWEETRGMSGFPNEHPPVDATNWGGAATKGTTTMVHIDYEGFGTAVTMLCGSKYWVVMRPKADTAAGEVGDQRSIHAYPRDWEHGRDGADVFEAEGLLLSAGDVFYMRPNTPHYVLGVENAIMAGRHFYSASTILDSCLGIVHAFILGYAITNQRGDFTRSLLRRVMIMWADHYGSSGSAFVSPLKLAHTPDITTQVGLCDVLMLGNIIELSEAFSLDSSTRNDENNLTIEEEEKVARWRYRQFFSWISANHIIVINGAIISPWYLFHRSLIEFASSLCAYKEAFPGKMGELSFTPAMLCEKTLGHIKSQWPMLLPRFMQLLESPTGLFTWTGPEFKVWRRDKLPPHFLILEVKELSGSPVFSFSCPEAEKGSRSGIAQVAEGDQSDNSGMDVDSANGRDESPFDGADGRVSVAGKVASRRKTGSLVKRSAKGKKTRRR